MESLAAMDDRGISHTENEVVERVSKAKYEVFEKLADGAHGLVCSVQKLATGGGIRGSSRFYVAKILEVDTGDEVDEGKHREIIPLEYHQIMLEVSAFKSLQKPDNQYVVKLYSTYHLYNSAGTNEVWLIMERLAFDLFFVVESLILTADEIGVILSRIILALEFVHDKGFIHRDLKLENVLFSRGGHIKLCDFGLTEKHTDERTVDQDTQGTDYIMAPELYIVGCTYDRTVDIWSLGVIAYYLTLRSYYDALHKHKSKSFGIEFGERGFQTILWKEYRKSDLDYFVTVMDPGAIDYDEMKYDEETTRRVKIDVNDEYYTARSREYRSVFDFCMQTLAPYPLTGPYGDIKREKYLERASLQNLKQDPLITSSEHGEYSYRKAVIEIMQKAEMASAEREGILG